MGSSPLTFLKILTCEIYRYTFHVKMAYQHFYDHLHVHSLLCCVTCILYCSLPCVVCFWSNCTSSYNNTCKSCFHEIDKREIILGITEVQCYCYFRILIVLFLLCIHVPEKYDCVRLNCVIKFQIHCFTYSQSTALVTFVLFTCCKTTFY